MSGYLARLTLRALGRPASAGVLPRVDAGVSVPTRDRDVDNALAIEREVASPSRERSEREGDGSAAPTPAPAPTIVPRLLARSATPRNHVADARAVAPARERHVASGPPQVALSSVERESRSMPVTLHVDGAGTEGAPRVPREPSAAMAATRSTPFADDGRQARPVARVAQPTQRVAVARGPRRDAATLDTAAPDADARDTAGTTPDKPAGMDIPRVLSMSTSAPASPRAGRDGEPASVTVEIGRIEVKVAPAPAPPSRARAAPQGFEGYWRMRNYLDRRRD